MPTSLVSTGVQFPDSTIQTTAATGSPNYTQIGTTIFWCAATSVALPIGQSAVGFRWATSNITTTRPILIDSPPVELQTSAALSVISVGSSSYVGARTGGGAALSNSNSSSNTPKLVRDGFTGRYSITPVRGDFSSPSTSFTRFINAFTTDFITWYPYQNASPTTSGPSVVAFNHYTGTRITIPAGSLDNDGTFTRTVAASAYNNTTVTNTFNFDTVSPTWTPSTVQNLGFIDTGTQGTSFFYVLGRKSTFPQYYTFLTSTDDGLTWTANTGVGYNAGPASRVVGSTAEIMFYSESGGVFRSTNLGVNWGNYNFGDNVGGTSTSFFARSAAWNGTTWLTVNSSSRSLATKAMGSGTTWTRLGNQSDFSGSSSAVAYNPTYAVWIVVTDNGRVFTNSNSDPNSGSWTFVAQLSSNPSNIDWNVMVIAGNTTNFA